MDIALKINTSTDYESMEDIALSYSNRGMTDLRPFLPEDFYQRTADKLLQLPKGTIFLTTGFCVGGVCETDGPPGTLCVAEVLKNLGYHPIIITDQLCRGFFEQMGLQVVYAEFQAEEAFFERVLEKYKPVALISIERCGKNQHADYANMRGISIASETAPIDRMFEIAQDRGIYTIGIGDGGNEIGMGNLKEQLRSCTDLNPCVVTVDDLLIATTSNWGAYALSAVLDRDKKAMREFDFIGNFIQFLAKEGCVDGVTKAANGTVDGFGPEVEKEIYLRLKNCQSKVSQV